MNEEHLLCSICGQHHPRGLGGTAMGRIFGLVPNTNALDVYHSLTRPQAEEPEGERSIHLYRGHVLEPMALSAFWKHTGWRGRNIPRVSTHPDYPAFQCHTDFEIFADAERQWEGKPAPEWMLGTGVGETKSPSSGVVSKIIDEGLRQGELLQAYTYAAVRRVAWSCFNFFTLEHEAGPTIPVPIELPKDLGEFLLTNGQRFWDEHIVPRVPPDPTEWELMAKAEMPPLPELDGGERIVVEDPTITETAKEVVEARDLFQDAAELYGSKKQRLEQLLVPLGHKRVSIEGVGRFSIVQKQGTVSFSRASLELARPLDWDLVRTLIAPGIEDQEDLDDLLAGMQLDLSRFERRGDPSQFVLLPRRAKDD